VAIKTTTIKLDDELHMRLRGVAEEKQRTPHWIMREAIEQYVAREEKRLRFYAEAKASWEQYQETGRFAEGTDVARWLESWGKNDEEEPPRCQSGA
jgi:predicted transcriptional regulator